MDNTHYFDLAEGAVMLEGFDDCVVGVSESFGEEPRLIYSKKQIITFFRPSVNSQGPLWDPSL